MKCQSCGAETKSAKYCEFCGSEMPKDKPTVNIVNNYYGNVNQMGSDSCSCPKYNKNDGYTYYPNDSKTTTITTKKHGFWWWLLVICFWPIPLSIWFYKTDKVNLEKKWKLAIITGFWVFMLIVSALSSDPETQTNETSIRVESTTLNNGIDENIYLYSI